MDRPSPVPATSAPSVPATTSTICPYLLADGGAWRSSTATRAHRCAAVKPAALLAADKQRRLCLTDEHDVCATFVAARSLRDAATFAVGVLPDRPATRSIARTTPLVLDHGRLSLSAPSAGMRMDRSTGQAVLLVLMAIAFAAILLARLTGGAGPGAGEVAGATGTPGASANTLQGDDVSASDDPPAMPSHDVPPSVEGTLDPIDAEATAGAPEATSAPDTGPTYVVRSGDTLSSIAGEHGTTWQVLAALNEIDDPGRLRVGQELRLP